MNFIRAYKFNPMANKRGCQVLINLDAVVSIEPRAGIISLKNGNKEVEYVVVKYANDTFETVLKSFDDMLETIEMLS